MLYCCAYIWTGFGAELLCVLGWVCVIVCGDFFEHVPLCVCFDCCFFIEMLRDFLCACVHTVREKVWTGADPLGELGAHIHRAGPAHNNTHRPHRWLPPTTTDDFCCRRKQLFTNWHFQPPLFDRRPELAKHLANRKLLVDFLIY